MLNRSANLPTFQSTRPRGARHLLPSERFLRGDVSIHAPTRGATLPPTQFPQTILSFNPRAHAGRDGCRSATNWYRHWFQSTRPRGARHNSLVGGQPEGVSIHAPTRGATNWIANIYCHQHVSIHAPTRGATCSVVRHPLRCRCFNPRAHAGRDSRGCGRPFTS